MSLKYKHFLVLFFGVIVLTSCKEDEKLTPLSALNVFNATADLPSVKVNTLGTPIDYAAYPDVITYGTNRLYSIPASNREISGVATVTPAQNVFSFSQKFQPGGIYSLFLAGQMPTVESIFLEEHFPSYAMADSSLAVRVINLSPNSAPVNVTLSATPTVNEFTGIAYKQLSDFKKYSAKTGVSNTAFNFQVRNASGALLSSYAFTAANLTAARWRSVTLVLRGLAGGSGSNALAVSYIGNY